MNLNTVLEMPLPPGFGPDFFFDADALLNMEGICRIPPVVRAQPKPKAEFDLGISATLQKAKLAEAFAAEQAALREELAKANSDAERRAKVEVRHAKERVEMHRARPPRMRLDPRPLPEPVVERQQRLMAQYDRATDGLQVAGHPILTDAFVLARCKARELALTAHTARQMAAFAANLKELAAFAAVSAQISIQGLAVAKTVKTPFPTLARALKALAEAARNG